MKDIKLDKKEMEFLMGLLYLNNDKKVAQTLYKRLQRATRPIKPSSAKGKGRNLQQWVCERISALTGIPYKQSDDDCLIHSRDMGLNGTDVILRGDAKEKFPYSIECKACETLSIPQWVEQAKANQQEGTDWMLIFKKHSMGSEPYVVLSWEAFEKLYRKALTKES